MQQERGNILFLILLAVVLFAALAMAVTRSFGVGENNRITDEKARAVTAEIMNKLVNTGNGLQRFLLSKNYKIEQIDIYDANYTVQGNNSQCATDACNLFSPNGGGVSVPILPLSALSPYADANCMSTYVKGGGIIPYIMIISATGNGTEASDIALYYNCLSRQICETINMRMGLRAKGDAPVNAPRGTASVPDYQAFQGNMSTITVTTANITTSAGDTRSANHSTFCLEAAEDSPGGSRLYHVIYAR